MKYRIVHKPTNKIVTEYQHKIRKGKYKSDGQLLLDPDGCLYCVLEDNSSGVTDIGIDEVESDDYIVQFSTRLKDKNNVEIYEGDIVKCFFPNNEEEIGIAEFRNGIYWAMGKEYPIIGLASTTVETVEVVGRIYENPDLQYDTCPKF